MAPFIAIAFWILGILLIYRSLRSLYQKSVSRSFWIASIAALATSLVVGVWIGFGAQYQVSESLIVFGFPIPVVFLALETYADGTSNWIDFIVPLPFFVGSGNAVLIASLLAPLIWIASKFIARKPAQQREATEHRAKDN